MSIKILKGTGLVEDLEFGFGDTEQERGGTKFNSSSLPYSETESVKQALDARQTTVISDEKYATINGDIAKVFNVAPATEDTQAMPKSQIEATAASKANKVSVLLRDDSLNNDGYVPSATYDPATKGYADGLIADKFLGAITVQFIAYSIVDGTTPVTVTVTNGVITGVV